MSTDNALSGFTIPTAEMLPGPIQGEPTAPSPNETTVNLLNDALR